MSKEEIRYSNLNPKDYEITNVEALIKDLFVLSDKFDDFCKRTGHYLPADLLNGVIHRNIEERKKK